MVNDFRETFFQAQQGSCKYEFTVVVIGHDLGKFKPDKLPAQKGEVGTKSYPQQRSCGF